MFLAMRIICTSIQGVSFLRTTTIGIMGLVFVEYYKLYSTINHTNHTKQIQKATETTEGVKKAAQPLTHPLCAYYYKPKQNIDRYENCRYL